MLIVFTLIFAGNGCSSIPSDVQFQDVSHVIQSGEKANTDTHDGYYFELLNYYKQNLYMKNGYTLSKWVYENDEYSCEKTIPLSQLFPQEYQNTDQTIEYVNNYAKNTVSCDGRFICIFDAKDPSAFYLWDTDVDDLYNIKPLSPIRKIQWADNESLLYILTEENKLYCIDPVSRNMTVTLKKISIPDVNEENIHLLKDGVIFYNGLEVLFASSESTEKSIVDNVIEFYGIYNNTLVVKRMDNKVEAGFIEDKWNPFYSEKIDYCNPINGQYLQIHATENHDEVKLLDLMSGNISSFKTLGYGYELFPKTNVIMFYDSKGSPNILKPDGNSIPLQLGHSEPYFNNTSVISILTHEADNKMNLQLFSLEDAQWLLLNINNKGEK